MRKHHSSTDFSRRVPLHWWILCSLIVLALIAVLRNSFSISSSTASVNVFYKNYRRLREQAASDFLEVRALAMGTNKQKELNLCNREMDNYVPCYNMLVGFHDGEEFDRHCEVSGVGRHCLVRPLKEYKIPIRWPVGRDVIWSSNVKVTKDQFLSSGTRTKRYPPLSGLMV